MDIHFPYEMVRAKGRNMVRVVRTNQKRWSNKKFPISTDLPFFFAHQINICFCGRKLKKLVDDENPRRRERSSLYGMESRFEKKQIANFESFCSNKTLKDLKASGKFCNS